MSNNEIIEWLKMKAEAVPMPGSRKMYHAAVMALEAQQDTISRKAVLDICDNAIDLWKGQLGAGALVAIRESIAELPPAQSVAVNCLDREIRPGDEVDRYVDGQRDVRAMFLAEDGDRWTCLFWTGCGYTTLSYPKSQFRRTGRHHEIEPILEGIRNKGGDEL